MQERKCNVSCTKVYFKTFFTNLVVSRCYFMFKRKKKIENAVAVKKKVAEHQSSLLSSRERRFVMFCTCQCLLLQAG